MLLSRFAESLYWAGRYLERAEATSRMVRVHTEMFLDLPNSTGIGWSPLLAVTGASDEFLGRHTDMSEEEVVGFLAIDSKNRGSVLSSISQARDGLRGSRTVLPRAAWEVVNDLHGWAIGSSKAAIDRRTRIDWLDTVVAECQLLAGALAGTMCDDEAYAFLQIGRHLERADMTVRVLDVQAGILMATPGEDESYADVTWMSVLRSLSAHQMFRRTSGAGMSGPAALRFLLQNPRFPRAVEFCVNATSRALVQLPRSAAPLASCARMRDRMADVEITDDISPEDLHELADELEAGIGELHDALADTYFRRPEIPAEPETEPVTANVS